MTTRRSAEQRISGPADLLQAVPYFLGFHPRRSLVLVGLRDGLHVVTARLDLSDAVRHGPVLATLGSMTRGGATTIVAIVFADPPAAPVSADGWPWTELMSGLDGHLAAAARQWRCKVSDVLLTAGGRWWSTDCDSPDCCPPEGRPLPDAPSPFAAGATVRGVVVQADREALAATLDPEPDERRRRFGDAITAATPPSERAVKRALFAAARASGEAGWTPPDDAALAGFAAALRTVTVRDAVWLAIDDRRIDGRQLWRRLGRLAPSPYDAQPWFLFGWASWRHGEGALATMAGERALASDPDLHAADLLLGALAQGIDPRTFPPLRRSQAGRSQAARTQARSRAGRPLRSVS